MNRVLAYHGVLNDEGEEVDGAALYGVAQDVHLLAHVPRLHPPVSTSLHGLNLRHWL